MPLLALHMSSREEGKSLCGGSTRQCAIQKCQDFIPITCRCRHLTLSPLSTLRTTTISLCDTRTRVLSGIAWEPPWPSRTATCRVWNVVPPVFSQSTTTTASRYAVLRVSGKSETRTDFFGSSDHTNRWKARIAISVAARYKCPPRTNPLHLHRRPSHTTSMTK